MNGEAGEIPLDPLLSKDTVKKCCELESRLPLDTDTESVGTLILDFPDAEL
jgi:hypothetical protein